MSGLDHVKGVIVHGFDLKCHQQTGKSHQKWWQVDPLARIQRDGGRRLETTSFRDEWSLKQCQGKHEQRQ